jgi:tetratricopeptide (TPR) repeat protein
VPAVLARFLIVLLACVASAGCHGVSRYRECQRVAKAVNPVLEEIKALDSSDQNAAVPDNYIAIAERYRSVDKALETLELGLSPDFKQGVTTYRQHLRTAAKEVDRYKEALDLRQRAGDADPKAVSAADGTLRQARDRMLKTSKAYGGAIDRLQALCAPRG